ncbi:MAG: hypothetical protein NVS1B7_5820 [Candidatus Saccharimonadales bacterium]
MLLTYKSTYAKVIIMKSHRNVNEAFDPEKQNNKPSRTGKAIGTVVVGAVAAVSLLHYHDHSPAEVTTNSTVEQVLQPGETLVGDVQRDLKAGHVNADYRPYVSTIVHDLHARGYNANNLPPGTSFNLPQDLVPGYLNTLKAQEHSQRP